MRSRLAHLTLVISLVVAFMWIGTPGIAQTHVTSLEELRRELATGDDIIIVPAAGQPLSGRLTRLGSADLDVRLVKKDNGRQAVTIPLDAIRSLVRRRDSVRNGAVIGAGIGAGVGGAFFVHALVIDRNEIDEWAPLYVRAAAVCTAIGGLIGWAIDAAHSKPYLRFDAPAAGRTKVTVQPAYSRGRGIGIAVSFAR